MNGVQFAGDLAQRNNLLVDSAESIAQQEWREKTACHEPTKNAL
jgi:hypothetical protein